LRSALYPDAAGVEVSVQMRLAMHTMNARLIMVWMPLGAAVMTCCLLRGENVRLTSRAMALPGAAIGLAQTPFGGQMAALANAF